MQIGDRVSIKRKELTFHGQEPVVQDSPVLATVTSVHAPSSFSVKYDQPQDDCNYREIPFNAIPEMVQIVSEIRDTQFAGFAELLSNELRGWELSKPDVKQIIARRAYDLVRHTIECTSHIDLDRLTSDEHTLRIPDLTTWPEETK